MKDKMNYNDMKRQASGDQELIELRSEKVRNLIGQIPPFLVRWGNTILVIILVLLGIACWVIVK
ncbi:hypothetical protein [Parabacteroides gordonii]|jgi:hypothetical protein|uniref:hypothetical protein n=1 Tax=Parabacteroides gordonii TaxID=574930 RepID=UPI00241EA0FA|nr:hypothetical protein [Parabacteroides gordonii]